MTRRSKDAASGHDKPDNMRARTNSFSIRLTFFFTIVTLSLSFILAFSIGCISRMILLSQTAQLHPSATANDEVTAIAITQKSKTMSGKKANQLPSPKVLEGKDVPYTTYTSKTFHTAATVTANTLHIDRSTAMLFMTGKSSKEDGGPDLKSDQSVVFNSVGENTGEWTTCAESPDSSCSRGKVPDHVNSMGHNSDADEEHLPAGQHLLIDLKDVSSVFLNSETRLAEAMISLINESRLTLLSYHCHSLVPIGVSCAGVLLESHVAFHTWPAEGVITLDLFTCGGMPLIPVLPLVEKLFGVEKEEKELGMNEERVLPSMLWAHKLRGFREGFAEGYDASENPLDGEMERVMLGKMDYDLKRPLISTRTNFQSFDVYEVLPSSKRSLTLYEKSLNTDIASYESLHPEYYKPNKLLFLGGVLQSTLYGEAAYHESIVHPPLIAHNNPKRVAVVGGGEGATLREVLKHRSIETVVMIEVDEEVVELSREYLKEWSNCSDIEGSDVDWCLENESIEVQFEDALAYFNSKYGRLHEDGIDERFDVVIMDALGPNDAPKNVEELYQSDHFIESLYRSLTDDGILAVQIGETPWYASAPDEVGVFSNRAIIIEKFQEVGFKSIHVYEESHSEIIGPWSTLLAFKDYSTRSNWYRSVAEIDLELLKRILPTKSGKRPLKYYDGATHFGYQMPPKPFETVDCRSWDGSNKCGRYGGFMPENINVPTSDMKLGKNGGVVVRRDIVNQSYIALDEQVKSMIARPSTWSIISSRREDDMRPIAKYFEASGVCNQILGETMCCAYPGILSFIKSDTQLYNCDDTSIGTNKKAADYSPLNDRHIEQLLRASKMALRDINQGEELIIRS